MLPGQVILSKNYMIDSENVGDAWISLLSFLKEDDRMIVFYTEHSPHMSYKNLIQLKESAHEVVFVKCFEGSNALDFQLCTELGWMIGEKPENEYIIVSNDNGFDAVIKYWGKKQRNVRRLKIADIKNELKSDRERHTETEPVEIPTRTDAPEGFPEFGEETASPFVPEDFPEMVSFEEEVFPPESLAGSPEFFEVPDDSEKNVAITDECLEILYLVGKDNLLELHQALTLIYGPAKGKAIYNELKNDASCRSFLQSHRKLSTSEKCKAYCEIVFSKAGVEMPEGFSDTVTESWKKKKNLNTLRGTLMTRYGKGSINTYYSLIKSHTKIIDKIR